MTEDLLDYWLRIIKPFFPANAWVVSRFSGSDYLIQIDWKLENDPREPGKRSRKIEIIIKEQVINDYLDKNKDQRALSDSKMKEWIFGRYNHFNLDHDAYTANSVSPEKWRISRDVLS